MRPRGFRFTRRKIQVMLGSLWILDACLQFQPAMFTPKFATQVIASAGAGQPAFVSWPVGEAARVILHHPAAANAGFGLIQLALGVGILRPRTARWALPASVGWALAVWYLGEGLGGLFGGSASLLTGAPGAAFVYALVALAVWPRPARGEDHGENERPARWAAVAWACLWLGGSVLQLLPGSDTNASLGMSLAMNASGAPAWLAAIDNRLSDLVPYYGVSLIVDLVALQVMAGLGALMARRVRLTAVSLGIGLSLVYWVAGQSMGQYWSGISTDPNTAPLVMLLGLAVLGAEPWSMNQTVRASRRDAKPRALPVAHAE